jgi:sugar phosphate isomerase/epimerase
LNVFNGEFIMIPEITVQLYSVREQASQNYEATLRAVAAMGFGNVEPAGFPGTTVEKAAKLFKELGLKAPSCHGALPVGDNKNKIIEEALTLGHRYIFTGCPTNFREDFSSVDRIKATAERYCEAAEFAAQHGLQIGYHNHDWDLVDEKGQRIYKTFLENTPSSVLWEADLYWVTKAGLNVVDFLKEIGSRGVVLHFKDGKINAQEKFSEAETVDGKIMVSKDKPFLPAGQGEVDLRGGFKAAKYAQYIAVELDSYAGDMMKAVEESYNYLTTSGMAKGKK